MNILAYRSSGYEGELICVEVDLRRGIPGTEIVGLPDSAVREARERVRVAIRNSGYRFPTERVLVNLSPAGLKKGGAAFDLAVALGILCASGQVRSATQSVLVMGELGLSGVVRPVTGVISAVSVAAARGIRRVVVPRANVAEVGAAGVECEVIAAVDLAGVADAFNRSAYRSERTGVPAAPTAWCGDYADVKGRILEKRAVEVAAAGMHNLVLFGPPGTGKTMTARRLPGIFPRLKLEDAREVTRIHSTAGILAAGSGIVGTAPFRAPHHTSSLEGMIGGGKRLKPGEISLAHRGVLFLDEASEFSRNVIQALRQPLEDGLIVLARADSTAWYPAVFQLVLATNLCRCGNLGRGDCLCSRSELDAYWRKIGGAVLDRIDVRVAFGVEAPSEILTDGYETSAAIRDRVDKAVDIQHERYRNEPFSRNSRLPAALVGRYCAIGDRAAHEYGIAAEKLLLSGRACLSVLKVARTIADLESSDGILPDHVLEAVHHRRFGENGFLDAISTTARRRVVSAACGR